VLTPKGTIETTRNLAFDESAPVACNQRADFSHFQDIDLSVAADEHQPVAPQPAPAVTQPASATTQPASSKSLPDMSPIPDTGASTATPEQTVNDRVFDINPNPLFDDTDESSYPVETAPSTSPQVELQPILQQPSGVPAPRRSSRSNKNVPPERYTEDAFRKYATGLPKKSANVTFADPVAFLL
jgi:hypothetical protein